MWLQISSLCQLNAPVRSCFTKARLCREVALLLLGLDQRVTLAKYTREHPVQIKTEMNHKDATVRLCVMVPNGASMTPNITLTIGLQMSHIVNKGGHNYNSGNKGANSYRYASL